MAVIVDNKRAADALSVEPRPRGAERAQAAGDVEQAIGTGANRRKAKARAVPGFMAGSTARD